jgi:hypothetical protein
MHRVFTGGLAVALLAAGAFWAPAGADVVGCAGPFNGTTTCDFTIPDGATGFTLTASADPGTAFAASAHCCELLNPLTGEPLDVPLLGQPLTPSESCTGFDGGGCELTVSFPLLLPVVQSRTAHCQIGPLDERPATGTWSCVPSF